MLDQKAKAARLVAVAKEEFGRKIPRKSKNPNSVYGLTMKWCGDYADKDDAWSWGVDREWSEEDWDEIILPKLGAWSKQTWGEIDKASSDSGHKMHHDMDCDAIREEAQYRLIEIEQHADVIFRFRLGNKKRLWGFRVLEEFNIIWYDPTHEIYPTDRD